VATPVVPRVEGLCYGGDYNPEQWPERVWAEDAALMREAGVNLVTVGVFAWSMLEPAPGRYEFGWLDRVLSTLHEAGVAVDLATATASPPAWFSAAHPESLPVDRDGTRLAFGSRQVFCASSVAYRERALALVEALAARYGGHPALALWHVHNEYGCHNAACYCEVSAAAFRDWLRRRYGDDIDALNEAWGTAFWSQRYTDWEHVGPPRATLTFANPTQVLDFRRFGSDALLDLFTAERDVLRRATPAIPITTNLMTGSFTRLDYWRWAREMPVVSNDHYLIGADPIPAPAQIAYAADLARSLAGGRPWLLMEHSTSAVNWQPCNLAKAPGQLVRDSLGHVARGSDGALFFQWRASRAGAEKWHSAMVPHAGRDSRIWREVVELGEHLKRLAPIAGSTVEASVAVLLDYPSGWAQEADAQPSHDLDCFTEIRRWHAALWRLGITADLAHPGSDLSGYRAVLVPALYLVDDAAAANLAGYVAGGGTLVVGAYSGVVDEFDHVRPGGYPGAFTDLLGVRVEEFCPLPDNGSVRLSDGSIGRVWSERGRVTGAQPVATYVDGPAAGSPAITRRGSAWYVGTRLDPASLERLLVTVLGPGSSGVERIRRRHPDGRSYLFLLNHGGVDADVAAHGTDLLTGAAFPGRLAAGQVAVVEETV
jgi:beta-galactosidase